ncbi:MAG: hypothetical protein AAGA61_08980, partial [Pseudomonadota bacterium]
MKRPTFLEGAIVAGALALCAGLLVVGLSPFFAAATVARVLVPVLALTYIIYLLVQSKARTGR